ncbi:MAG TPA: diacylglycerol kinase family protein, partial [Kofleriaceae bacterium]
MRRVAIMLNRNAQGVTASRIARVRAIAGGEHVFVTASADDARGAIAAIVARGYDVLCTGGGDGTFVHAVGELRAYAQWPILFGLRLGSGNAIADVCGARRPTWCGLAADLARAAGGEAPHALRVLEVDGRLAHSAGFGLDAEFNEDLARVAKAGLRRPWLHPLLAGGRGLYLTAAVRTVPRLARARGHW